MRYSVVIPTIGKNNMIINLINQINNISDESLDQILVLDNGSPEYVIDELSKIKNVIVINCVNVGIYSMWNIGVKEVLKRNQNNYICIFNDDIIIEETNTWFYDLISPLFNDDVWASCANYNQRFSEEKYVEVTGTFKDNGFGGFCFVVDPKAYLNGLPLFDKNYYWWYGDDDFVHCIHRKKKKTVLSINAKIHHINGGSQSVTQYTPSFNEKVEKDRIYYLEKWHALR